MTEALYLSVADVMAIMQCKRTYAYDLMERCGWPS